MALPHQVGLEIIYDGTVKQGTAAADQGVISSTKGGGTYTIVSGDTLWSLAKRYYGSGKKYTIIYNANAEVIEAAAKAHGFTSSDNGNRIWPGTVLGIPEIETTTPASSLITNGTSNERLGKKIAKQASAVSYTDVASGQSDSVSITMSDIAKEWIGSLMPERGASLGVKLRLTNWNQEEQTDIFNCGTFILDDISFSGRPLSCVLGGVSVPALEDFKSMQRTKTWKKTTIKDIASEIAKRAGVSLYYDANAVQISEIEQSKQADSAFLYSLCEKYGLAMKVYNKKIVIFDIVAYEKKAAVLTLKESDMLSWTYNMTINGTYTGVTLSYTNPDSNKTISVTVGTSGRMYSMNAQATSRYDAELQATAKLNAANREIETMEITIRANIKIVAGHCIQVKGLGNADGKYYVDKVKHSIGSGYKMQLTVHKVQAAINDAGGTSGNGGSGGTKGGGNYTVVSGDSLWALAKKFYGSGKKWPIIFDANAEVIMAAEKAHGRTGTEASPWLYPGTVLTIPEV